MQKGEGIVACLVEVFALVIAGLVLLPIIITQIGIVLDTVSLMWLTAILIGLIPLFFVVRIILSILGVFRNR